MRQDNYNDGNQAAIVITPHIFDKRALYTTDLIPLSISLFNLNHLSVHYPQKVTSLLQQNGTVEILIKRLIELSRRSDQRSQLGFSNGLACLCNSTCVGGSKIRYRLIQANLIPILLPPLEKACTILLSISETWETKKNYFRKPRNPTSNTFENRQEFQNFPVDGLNSNIRHQTVFTSQEAVNDYPKVTVHDLLMVITMIAYISKYEQLRSILHNHAPLFHHVEQLTAPSIIPELRKWAILCMRNSARSAPGSHIKRCGSLQCPVKKCLNPTLFCSRCACVFYCR